MKGGYQILDLSGYALESLSKIIIKGIYDKIKNKSNDKALLIHGLNLDNMSFNDCFFSVKPNGTELYLNSFICTIVVNDNDEIYASYITIEEISPDDE